MSQQYRFPALAPMPKTSAPGFTISHPLPPKRISVRVACQRCREKRIRCDGIYPCSHCRRTGLDCIHRKSQTLLIRELLDENKHLKKVNAEKEKLLQAFGLSYDIEASKSLTENLKNTNKSRQNALQTIENLHHVLDDLTGVERNELSLPALANISVKLATGPSAAYCTPNSTLLRPPRSTIRQAEATMLLSSQGMPTPTSLPLAPTTTGVVESEAESCASLQSVGARQLFASLATWDCIPFCIICQAQFLEAFDTGSRQFCSPALSNAVLALAIRELIETENETQSTATNTLGSKYFFDKAVRILQHSPHASQLPNTQALGILSLYQLSCGHEIAALELALSLLSGITRLCDQQSLAERGDTQFLRLIRTRSVQHRDFLRTNQLSSLVISTDEWNTALASKWVYGFLSKLAMIPAGTIKSHLVSIYKDCLNWYEDLFTLLKAEAVNTPASLLVQMHYHFCILELFRPFVGLWPGDKLLQPNVSCAESAQAILSLAQSYERLFTLRRISGFAPYFVLAAGLYSNITMESSPHDCFSNLGYVDNAMPTTSPHPSQNGAMYGQYRLSDFQQPLQMSAAGSAFNLLQKMQSHKLVVQMARLGGHR
ncbi:nitrate assimilation regulatory protein nirA [Beauveria bassiana ARSEF 2860]|uniref:Nitrate assimilation regulatory protein nirA n=1 Tax=Beauveria bassiana (strain ARSEF 2860) TaxID=655819 RepID=J4UEL3_BEAB2|nr:nitrate assimilation regulatory protein nirA [Beauveria bassiana ARSEF 2860]EJP60692.1 nitrate assimilation regulatory protein nirA [Beauveria bassiana ARSEF 2860]